MCLSDTLGGSASELDLMRVGQSQDVFSPVIALVYGVMEARIGRTEL